VVPAEAFAYCRTTTCAEPNPPASCVRDATTDCWTTGIPLAWASSCVSFSVAQSGSKTLGIDYASANDIVAAAFARWLNADCGAGFPAIGVAATPATTCERVEYRADGPNRNAVLFRDGPWPHDDAILALTSVTFKRMTGEIVDADMEVNAPAITLADLPFVVTHEAGHFFGLDHSAETDAVMYPQFSGAFTAAGAPSALAADDVSGICAAYPPTQASPVSCVFDPANGFVPECPGDSGSGCSVAPPVAASAPDWTRRRSRWGAGLVVPIAAVAVLVLTRKRTRRPGAADRGCR
jgi:hypothetical protein